MDDLPKLSISYTSVGMFNFRRFQKDGLTLYTGGNVE